MLKTRIFPRENFSSCDKWENLGDSRIAKPDLANSTRFQVQIKERLTERLSRPRPGAAGHAALRPRGGRRGDRRVSAAPVHNTALVLRTVRQTVAQYSTSTTNRPPNPAAVTVEDRSPVRPSGGSVSFLQAGLLAGALIFFRLVGDGLAHELSWTSPQSSNIRSSKTFVIISNKPRHITH